MPRLERIDKKELKQDELVTFMARASDWARANANLVVGILAVVIAASVLFGFWWKGRAGKGVESNVRIAAAVGALNAGEYQLTLDMVGNVQTNYSGSWAAITGHYLAGQAYLQLSQFLEAEQSFNNYLNQVDKAPFYEQAARRGLAASLEGQQRHAEAAQLYLQVVENSLEPVASEVRIDAARALRFAGQMAEATRLLEQVEAEKNQYSRQASLELAVLQGLSSAVMTDVPQPEGASAAPTAETPEQVTGEEPTGGTPTP